MDLLELETVERVIKPYGQVGQAYKFEPDFEIDGMVAEEILVLQDGKAIALYTNEVSVLYETLDELLFAHNACIDYYVASKSLLDYWNSEEYIIVEVN